MIFPAEYRTGLLQEGPTQEGPKCVPMSALYIVPGLDWESPYKRAGGSDLVGCGIPDFWREAGYETTRLPAKVEYMKAMLLVNGKPLHINALWDQEWDGHEMTGHGELPRPSDWRARLHAFVIYGWFYYNNNLLWLAATTLPRLKLFHFTDTYRARISEVWAVEGGPD